MATQEDLFQQLLLDYAKKNVSVCLQQLICWILLAICCWNCTYFVTDSNTTTTYEDFCYLKHIVNNHQVPVQLISDRLIPNQSEAFCYFNDWLCISTASSPIKLMLCSVWQTATSWKLTLLEGRSECMTWPLSCDHWTRLCLCYTRHLALI